MKKVLVTWGLLLVATTFALALAYVYWSGIPLTPHAKAAELGQLGDFFGGLLNPLVSALTLFVAISVWRLQKDELELTRNEMVQTKLAMKEQAETAEQQRQEQRFFDLLNVYCRTVDCVSFTRREIGPYAAEPEKFEGKFAISAWLKASPTIRKFLENRGSAIPRKGSDTNDDDIQQMDRILVEWNEKDAKEYFDSYFRVVRHLLSEAQDLLGDQHIRYVTLFCAQLSKAETVLLALYLWLDPEGQDTQGLASKYRLLKDLPVGDLRTELESELPSEAF